MIGSCLSYIFLLEYVPYTLYRGKTAGQGGHLVTRFYLPLYGSIIDMSTYKCVGLQLQKHPQDILNEITVSYQYPCPSLRIQIWYKNIGDGCFNVMKTSTSRTYSMGIGDIQALW